MRSEGGPPLRPQDTICAALRSRRSGPFRSFPLGAQECVVVTSLAAAEVGRSQTREVSRRESVRGTRKELVDVHGFRYGLNKISVYTKLLYSGGGGGFRRQS